MAPMAFSDSESDLANYKRALASVEEQLAFYKQNEVTFTDKSCLFVPPSIDLSYSGIEKFKEPEFEGYGLRANKSVCKNSSNETKKNPDAPLIEEWVFDNEDEVESPVVVEKKTVVPTIPKVDVVRPKQQEKLVTKPVKYAEMYRQANTARPKAVVNAVRTNRLNVVKASTCWGNPETELEDLVRLNSPADKKLPCCSSGGDVYPCQAYDTKLITTEQMSVIKTKEVLKRKNL
ncbi:hypothetical protein Tco_1293535 [Tanacetum coccineum]